MATPIKEYPIVGAVLFYVIFLVNPVIFETIGGQILSFYPLENIDQSSFKCEFYAVMMMCVFVCLDRVIVNFALYSRNNKKNHAPEGQYSAADSWWCEHYSREGTL